MALPAFELGAIDERRRLVDDIGVLPANRKGAVECHAGLRKTAGHFVDERLVQQASGQDRWNVNGLGDLGSSTRIIERLLEVVAKERRLPHRHQGLSLPTTIAAVLAQAERVLRLG